MAKNSFIIQGNICSDRIRLGRAMHKPPLSQEGLAMKIQFMGVADMTSVIISRIESNKRHVCDAELRIIAEALDVSMDWLVGNTDVPKRHND